MTVRPRVPPDEKASRQYEVRLYVRESWTAIVTASNAHEAESKALDGAWDDVYPNSDRKFTSAKARRRDA